MKNEKPKDAPKFPMWTPPALISLYESRKKFSIPDHRALYETALLNVGYSPEIAKAMAKRESDKDFFLPEIERHELLIKLMTDQRMETIWKNIAKRISEKSGYATLISNIEHSITGWRRSLKLTPREQTDYFLRIHNLAIELHGVLKDVPTGEFISEMRPTNLIEDKRVRYYLEDALGVNLQSMVGDYIKNEDEAISYAKFWLEEVVPSLGSVLLNIALVAARNLKAPVSLKKPNSKKASTHYFIKSLSSSMRREFSQPLHETVATITRVVFDDDSIDTDLVRKITQGIPGGLKPKTPPIPPGNFPNKLFEKSSVKKRS